MESQERNGDQEPTPDPALEEAPAPAQLFTPGDCLAQLGAARSRQRNVYWRITAIDTNIELSPLVDEKRPPNKQVKPGVSSYLALRIPDRRCVQSLVGHRAGHYGADG